MSDTLAGMGQKMGRVTELRGVVRTMKTLAAAAIGQYERAAHASADYHDAVELGLAASLRGEGEDPAPVPANPGAPAGAVIFGSDQGLVGQFNETIADFAVGQLRGGRTGARIWAVGGRVAARLEEAGLTPAGAFAVPSSVQAIAGLVGDVLVAVEQAREREGLSELFIFRNQERSGAAYAPIRTRALPIDGAWRREICGRPWPTHNLPEVYGERRGTLAALLREYLFVTLYRACAESLASENASRLAAMQRAERKIDEVHEDLGRQFNRLRQSSIDEEMFDVISGFESLARSR